MRRSKAADTIIHLQKGLGGGDHMNVRRRKIRLGQVTLFCAMLLLFGWGYGCGRSEEGGDTTPAGAKDSYAALKAENEALRRENQMLRRELISKNGALPDSVMPEKVRDSADNVYPADKDTGYWMSSKTKVRHNRRCRNYRKVKGYPCGPKDGRPCMTCGG